MIAAALGSAMNAIAGGGTLLTFPALVALGIPSIVANATSTVALWPGALGSMWGYRGELSGARPWAIRFAVPSVLGGLLGALLLLVTPADRFDLLVPFLVLGATLLFIAQPPLLQWLRARRARSGIADREVGDGAGGPPSLGIMLYQFLIAIYGGYFGAGIGILMLAALGFMGLTNIHRMNGLKNWGGLCINAAAALTFAMTSLVDWSVAMAMAAGAIVGGYGGSRLAQRIPQVWVRRAIIVIGLGSGVWLMSQR